MAGKTGVVIPTPIIPTSYCHKENTSHNLIEGRYEERMLDLYETYKSKLKGAREEEASKKKSEEQNLTRQETTETKGSVAQEKTEDSNTKVSPSNKAQFLLDIEFIAKNRAEVASLLAANIHHLDSNLASFEFLTLEQQEKKKEELLYLFYLIYAQYNIDLAETRQYALKKHRENINKCSKLLEQLNLLIHKCKHQNETYETFKYQLSIEEIWTEKYLRISGFFLGKIVVQAIHDLFYGSTSKTLKEWMSDVNGLRLEWVWEGGLLRAILDLWPTSLFNKTQTTASLDILSPITGYISWILYYFRGGLELFALMKHTTNALWWKSAEEDKIPLKDRFLTQWNERKFRIWNDFIWATANLLCFLVLTGIGVLGYFGNVVTAFLLLMDVCLTYWKFKEAETKHNATITAWENEKNLFNLSDYNLKNSKDGLTQEIKTLRNSINSIGQEDKTVNKLLAAEEEAKRKARFLKRILKMSAPEREAKAENLQAMINKKTYEWNYEHQGFTKDILYAVGLLVSFGLVCCFFIPPAQILATTALSIALVGAALCFIITVANSAYESYLDYTKFKDNHDKTENLWASTLASLKQKTDNLKKLPADHPQLARLVCEQKELYLELKSLVVDSYLQQESVSLQKLKIAKKMLFDIMLPVAVFSALMFAPLSIGLPVLGAFLAIFAIIHLIVKSQEPKKEKMLDFNEKNFNTFINSIETIEINEAASLQAKQLLLKINDNEEAKANSKGLFSHTQKPDDNGPLPTPSPSI